MFEGVRVDEFCSSPSRVFEAGGYEHGATLTQIVARGESASMTGTLIGQLFDVDEQQLDRDGRVGLAAGVQRAINALTARLAEVTAATVAATPPVEDWLTGEQVAAADLGAALSLGAGGASSLVSDSLAVCGRLPDTLALARSGELLWRKATVLADAVAPLSDAQARAVEARVLPRAAGRTPAQHAAAVRRAVDRIDPAGAEERRRKAAKEIRLARRHLGAGMGELYAHLTSEDLDTVWAGADAWARRAKAAGDPRTLEQLRVAALVAWAKSFLTHGDPSYCDQTCNPSTEPAADANPADDMGAQDTTGSSTEPAAEAEPSPQTNAPTRHGRPVLVPVEWDLTSLLGLTQHCGRLTASDATLPPGVMAGLLAGGARIRRLLIDPTTGELVDLTPIAWQLPASDGSPHPQPVELRLIVNGPPGAAADDLALRDYNVLEQQPAAIHEALAALPDGALADLLTELLAHPITALTLDSRPDNPVPSAALAAFLLARDGNPVNPTAGHSDAAAGDLDHHQARSQGGTTTRRNLASLIRRWHLLKTHADWKVKKRLHGWLWTSPTGRTYRTEPHDYRLGP